MLYKEWIKTRWFYAVALLTTFALCGYMLLNINRLVSLKGAAHLWEVAMFRDAIFIDMLRYVPLLVGIVAAVVQFVPELVHKRLKLTMHLPRGYVRSVMEMLLFGFGCLALLFCGNLVLLMLGLQTFFADEIVWHIVLTALPWYLAGLSAYILVAWICLEPIWRRRILNILISIACLRVFYMSPAPEAYNRLLPWLAGLVVVSLALPLLSVVRFKEGKE